jgi:glycine cleavage system H protein
LTPFLGLDRLRPRAHPSATITIRESHVADIPKDLLYTEDHEYVKGSGDTVYIGITDYAQGELGDIVFIELPQVGATFKKHDVFGTVEAVKAVSELYSPVSGTVTAINDKLEKEPALVNNSPYGDGWMIQLKLTNAKERDALLKSDAYGKLLSK